ncbi:MFS transporter [Ruania alba]|uniref:Predicted arabinose efflux permease, MFS family n=1 Tax=Ruania alba TaxID=648782 RepID=A0A1H5MVJ9_9MICO|nr:MFS transporter [Ruania alba]SEE93389.1 Predicted arabinose efflux permease, MFS family [Ruania alba]
MTSQQRTTSPLSKRLRPLHVAAFLQGIGFWVPVEKLFMSEIGFTPASIGMMAAAYAMVVPLLEVPSGVLADRWSRRGVLIIASVALVVSALLGGLSHDLPMYFLSALVLGVYFAMFSGTMDSVVYDTVLEETGHSEAYERHLGHNRLVNSLAMVSSALAGGALAELLGTRVTYLITVPVVALSIVALLRFVEPQLHLAAERTPLRTHLMQTCQALANRGRMIPIVTLAVLTALMLQMMLEFSPLWLVVLAAPTFLYGPHWAGIVGSLGLGGVLAGRVDLDRPRTAAVIAVLMTATGVTLAVTGQVVVVVAAQILLVLLIVAASIHVSRMLHDAVPSAVRSGVASGVSTLSWIVFLPVAAIFGVITETDGVHTSGWIITALAIAAGASLVVAARCRSARDLNGAVSSPSADRDLATEPSI